MTSEERIDELEKRVRIIELANDNLTRRIDELSKAMKLANESIHNFQKMFVVQNAINKINAMKK